MAIEYNEIWSARTQSRDEDKDGRPNWQASRSWSVVTQSDEAALTAVPEAQKGSPHDRTPSLRVKSRSVKPEGLNVQIVTASYEVPIEDGDTNTNPLFAPVEYFYDKREDKIPTDRDPNGNAIVNSVGDPFDGGGDFDLLTYIYRITINQPYFDSKVANRFANKLCAGSFSTPFGTFERGEVLFKSVLPREPWTKFTRYVKCDYEFEIRLKENFPGIPDGASPFDKRFLDQGLRAFYQTTDGKLDRGKIINAQGLVVPREVRLDGAGKTIDETYKVQGGLDQINGYNIKVAKIERADKGDVKAVFLWYPQYLYQDFGPLNLNFR